MIIIMA